MSRLARLNEKNAGSTEEKPPLEIVEKTTFIIEEDATQKDSTYWNEVRPIPLTNEESASLSTVSASGTKLAGRDSSTISVTLGGVISE
ncbi:MAG: hypothetical protein MZV63_68660 [Marinilabiliales bacterium]|nr:hypothetical protein [Marinilabiliales bacterium]